MTHGAPGTGSRPRITAPRAPAQGAGRSAVPIRMSVAVLTLGVMSTATLHRYRLTVALPRPPGNDVLLRPDAQVLAEAAAAAVAAADSMTAWTSAHAVLSMTVEVPREADALSAGWAVARALGGGHGTSVEAAPAGNQPPGWPSPECRPGGLA